MMLIQYVAESFCLSLISESKLKKIEAHLIGYLICLAPLLRGSDIPCVSRSFRNWVEFCIIAAIFWMTVQNLIKIVIIDSDFVKGRFELLARSQRLNLVFGQTLAHIIIMVICINVYLRYFTLATVPIFAISLYLILYSTWLMVNRLDSYIYTIQEYQVTIATQMLEIDRLKRMSANS